MSGCTAPKIIAPLSDEEVQSCESLQVAVEKFMMYKIGSVVLLPDAYNEIRKQVLKQYDKTSLDPLFSQLYCWGVPIGMGYANCVVFFDTPSKKEGI